MLYVGSLVAEKVSRTLSDVINNVGSVPAGKVKVVVAFGASVTLNLNAVETVETCPDKTPTSICVLLRMVIFYSLDVYVAENVARNPFGVLDDTFYTRRDICYHCVS